MIKQEFSSPKQRCLSPVLVQIKSRVWIFLCTDFGLVPESSLNWTRTKFRFQFWGYFQRWKKLLKSLFSQLVTEVWELENGKSKIIEPTLPDNEYAVGIALYVVEKDFCKKWKSILSKLVLGKDLNKFIALNAVSF